MAGTSVKMLVAAVSAALAMAVAPVGALASEEVSRVDVERALMERGHTVVDDANVRSVLDVRTIAKGPFRPNIALACDDVPEVGSDVQCRMIAVQDAQSAYNQYLQGASSHISGLQVQTQQMANEIG